MGDAIEPAGGGLGLIRNSYRRVCVRVRGVRNVHTCTFVTLDTLVREQKKALLLIYLKDGYMVDK